MRTASIWLVLLGMAGVGIAGEPLVPPPLAVPAPLPPMGYYRVSAYEVWQNLAVDNRGFFRARVIWTPNGSFYRYNGQPYPFTTTQQYRFTPLWNPEPPYLMPYASD